MEEKIIKIASSINEHRTKEREAKITNLAVGRVMTDYDGTPKEIWLINQSADLNSVHGQIGGVLVNRPLTGHGVPVTKNSKLGALLITNRNGTHQLEAPGGIFNIEIIDRAFYIPHPEEVAKNINIDITSEDSTRYYNSLSKIIDLQNKIEKQEAALSQARDIHDEVEIERITALLQKDKQMLEENLSKTQSFVRTAVDLQLVPILDPTQEKIKRSNIFDRKLIINGGPGTGKTTSLIQRIKFLISQDILEYKKITPNQLNILSSGSTQWVFFTPSELLALYLKNAMAQEGLPASNRTVKIWSTFRSNLLRTYGLTNPETNRPFQIYRDTEANLLLGWHTGTKFFINDFKNFLFEHHTSQLKKIIPVNYGDAQLNTVSNQIFSSIEKIEFSTEEDLLRFYFNLRVNHFSIIEKANAEYIALSNRLSAELFSVIKGDQSLFNELINIVNQFSIKEDLDAQDNTLEEETEDEFLNESETDLKVTYLLKSFIQQYAQNKKLKATKYSKRNLEVLKIVTVPDNDERYSMLGDLAVFRLLFRKLTSGIVKNIYADLPDVYKKFRKQQVDNGYKHWNKKVAKDLIDKEKNIYLHPDEQAFLMYFINTLNSVFYKNFNSAYRESDHKYITAFNENTKAVIAIDEASDFSPIDLLCMSSFNHPDFNCVTLAGDIMQRITAGGLTAWKDYMKFFGNGVVLKDLLISYRQSQTLLDLAASIQMQVGENKNISYESYLPASDAEPKPLLKITEDEDAKMSWIVERILDIYRIYGFLPSVAVFLPNENQLSEFAEKMGQYPELLGPGVDVVACHGGKVLGDPDSIRIFSIDKIKGLEFQAVFFHNIDEMVTEVKDEKLLLKHLYVGISRAAFFLALTANREFDGKLNFMRDLDMEIDGSWRGL